MQRGAAEHPKLAGAADARSARPAAATDPTAGEVTAEYSSQSGARVVVVDADGVVVATSDADQSRVGVSYASRPELEAALEGRIASGERISETLAQLARASGGSARLEPRPGGGLDASVTLPAAPR